LKLSAHKAKGAVAPFLALPEARLESRTQSGAEHYASTRTCSTMTAATVRFVTGSISTMLPMARFSP